MAINASLVTMVRVLISDSSGSQYSDDQIEDAIAVASMIVLGEYSFSTTYTVNLNSNTISPDPVDTSDNIAIGLFTLKASCILNTNTYQAAVLNGSLGVKIKDGDSQIDLSGGFNGYRDILDKGPCKSYDRLLRTVEQNRSMNLGRAIGTPMTHPDYTGPYSYSNVMSFFDCFRYVR